MGKIKLITLNIGNPSIQRVQKQIDWLKEQDADIFILTETKVSEGCNFLEEYYSNPCATIFDLGKKLEYNVVFPKSQTGDLGVMILSKYPVLEKRHCFDCNTPFYSRLADIIVDVNGKQLGIMGMYVPSRDASPDKILRKKNFIIEYLLHLKSTSENCLIPYILCGDLNILEPNHIPHYGNFKKWEYEFYERFDHFGYIDAFRYLHPTQNEYSWIGRTGDGYRYDHCFVSKSLQHNIQTCQYLHSTRNTGLTDHAALSLTIDF